MLALADVEGSVDVRVEGGAQPKKVTAEQLANPELLPSLCHKRRGRLRFALLGAEPTPRLTSRDVTRLVVVAHHERR